jgi:hypothetical protein
MEGKLPTKKKWKALTSRRTSYVSPFVSFTYAERETKFIKKQNLKTQMTVYRIELPTAYKIFWPTDNMKACINIVKMEFMP